MKILRGRLKSDAGQSGQMLVAVIVLLTLLFFVGTAMALAVSSSLRTVAIAASTDATSYAAEAAVAQGTASAASGISSYHPCQPADQPQPLGPLGTKMNGQPLSALTCYEQVAPGAAVHTWAVQAKELRTESCSPILPAFPISDAGGTAWGVIGWHASGAGSPTGLAVSLVGCPTADPDAVPSSPCSTTVAGGLLYFRCAVSTDKNTLYLVNPGGPKNVTAFVVREADLPVTGGENPRAEAENAASDCIASAAHDCIATTLGMASLMADESDLRLPGGHWKNVTPLLWNRVFP